MFPVVPDFVILASESSLISYVVPRLSADEPVGPSYAVSAGIGV